MKACLPMHFQKNPPTHLFDYQLQLDRFSVFVSYQFNSEKNALEVQYQINLVSLSFSDENPNEINDNDGDGGQLFSKILANVCSVLKIL